MPEIFKLELLLKIVVTLFCSSGLMYHSYELYGQYMSGSTVVSIEVARMTNQTLHGITICYPFAISFERASKVSNEIAEAFRSYHENGHMKINNDSTDSDQDQMYFKAAGSNYKRLTGYYLMDNIAQESGLNLLNLVENLSFPFIIQDGPDHSNAIGITMRGKIGHTGSGLNNFVRVEYLEQYDEITYVGKPIESILVDYGANGEIESKKCFTFFSGLQKPFRDLTFDLDTIDITISYQDKLWFPRGSVENIYISMHSPNTLPDMKIGENFLELDFNQDSYLTYSQINIDRLDSSYDTNCYEYDLDYKYANFNMRSDCIATCYLNKMRKVCKLAKSNVLSPLLIRKQRIENDEIKTVKVCSTTEENIKVKFECTRQCKTDCKFKNFALDLAKKTVKTTTASTDIHIRHNSLPDVDIKHLPETTFIEFICNFGGLLGMWLGLSMVSLYDIISRIFKHGSISNFFIFNVNLHKSQNVLQKNPLERVWNVHDHN